jgi:NAD(P)-dependent dehydrogenase (short-subunit alcohol dehydrogenase family)
MGVAVVTGAGSGLGRSISRALLGAGALEETASAPGWSAESTLAVPTDVTSPSSVAALFDLVRRRWGRLDLLVNNAGVPGPSGQADEIDLADWQRVVDTNLTGAFLCAQHAVRMMKTQTPRGGRIINNGSISAHTPRPGSICYTATKHAMTGLTKALSLDGRAFDIACGQIDIGNAATEMTRRFSRGVPQADGSIAPEPTFDARHVADAVLYMASLPLDANVQFLTITATKMPYIGRG